jgi:hypothetical protein
MAYTLLYKQFEKTDRILFEHHTGSTKANTGISNTYNTGTRTEYSYTNTSSARIERVVTGQQLWLHVLSDQYNVYPEISALYLIDSV